MGPAARRSPVAAAFVLRSDPSRAGARQTQPAPVAVVPAERPASADRGAPRAPGRHRADSDAPTCERHPTATAVARLLDDLSSTDRRRPADRRARSAALQPRPRRARRSRGARGPARPVHRHARGGKSATRGRAVPASDGSRPTGPSAMRSAASRRSSRPNSARRSRRPERRRGRARRGHPIAGQTIPTGVAASAAAERDRRHRRRRTSASTPTSRSSTPGSPTHPDLNVAGGYNCSTERSGRRGATNDHGTHVAGTVGALDNGIGVVGVAPGARLWAVKILNDDGYGLHLLVRLRPGLDPRPARPDRREPAAVRGGQHERHEDRLRRPGLRPDRTTTPSTRRSAASSRAGSRSWPRPPTTPTAPPNASRPATTRSSPSRPWPTRTASPAGSAATLLLVGDLRQGRHVRRTSATTAATSTSSRRASASGRPCPGPLRLLVRDVAWRRRPSPAPSRCTRRAARTATPAEVKEALQYLGNLDWKTSTDPDSHPRDAARRLAARQRSATSRLRDARASSRRPARPGQDRRRPGHHRSATSTFFERVRVSRHVAADRLERRRSRPTSLLGWTANVTTRCDRDRPDAAPGRDATTQVTAPNQGRTETTTVPVDRRDTTARPRRRRSRRPPRVQPGRGSPSRTSAGTWPAATDPPSAIAGYEATAGSTDGAWAATTTGRAAARQDASSRLEPGHRLRSSASGPGRGRQLEPVGRESSATSSATVDDRSPSTSPTAGLVAHDVVDAATNRVRTTSAQAGASGHA